MAVLSSCSCPFCSQAACAEASEVTECPESLPFQKAMEGASAPAILVYEDDTGFYDNFDCSEETTASGSHQGGAVEALEHGADQVGVVLWCARQPFHGWTSLFVHAA